MQLLEHQAKDLLQAAGLPVPTGRLIGPQDSLDDIALPAVVKSQVPIGGRGKLGGIKLVRTFTELKEAVATILQLNIKGFVPETVLVEEALAIKKEVYIALRVNRDTQRAEYIVSNEGGVEIEAHTSSISTFPATAPERFQQVAMLLQLEPKASQRLLSSLEKAFYENDCLLLEINPLVITEKNAPVCADAKVLIDDNARFRHPTLPWRDEPSVKPLGGTIGVIANGAGMAMSTMDTIYAAGGTPANFLDIGGGTGEDVFVKNLRDIMTLPNVSSIIINIFAGITRCDDIARGIISAKQQIPELVPLYIRLEGTNRSEAATLLTAAGIPLEPDLQSCVTKAMREASTAPPSEGVEVMLNRATPSSGKSSSASEVKEERTTGSGTNNLRKEPKRLPENDSTSILLHNQPVIVQGITGHHGAFHTQGMLAAGTAIVAGVTPGKGGESVHGVPVYNTVAEAVATHGAATSVVFVPARFAKAAVLEALEAGITLVVIITEGIPVHDMLVLRERALARGARIIGPNCPGLIIPGSHKLGIIAAHITSPGNTTVISRSGTLTYELADALTKRGVGQRLILGIGGDPVQGTTFVEAIRIAENDPHTERIVLIGEIGGEGENIAADHIAGNVTKPVYGLVVGHSLPAGQTFGHAGAIVGHHGESADQKTVYMASKGIHMSHTLDELISAL
jgi:succinyl-CoA synthetase alpha subunit